jgi:hypothetical protein
MKLTLTGVTPDFYLEFVVMKNLIQEFRELGFNFTKAYPHAVIEDEENVIFEECDITLENSEKVMIVDVISVPTTGDISEHVERMKKIRTYAYLHRDNRTFLGAIAGMNINNSDWKFALKNGIYVIEPAEREPCIEDATQFYIPVEYIGETFTITVPESVSPPANQVYPVTKTIFPLPLQNKRPNRYARQS